MQEFLVYPMRRQQVEYFAAWGPDFISIKHDPRHLIVELKHELF